MLNILNILSVLKNILQKQCQDAAPKYGFWYFRYNMSEDWV